MLNSILRIKPTRILINLKDTNNVWHLSKIAKASSVTYVFVTKFASKLEKAGIVTLETVGKKRVIKLTDKGMQIANLLDEVEKKLQG